MTPNPWLNAITDADQGRDPKLVGLIKILLSDRAIESRDRKLLADFLGRYKFAKKPGRQRTPIYRPSEAEGRLALAAEEVREYMAGSFGKKMNFDDAVRFTAPANGIKNYETLVNYMTGRRGSTRVQRARRRL